MTNNELLLEITNIIGLQLQPVNEKLDRIDTLIGKLEKRMDSLEDRMHSLENRVASLESKVASLENGVKKSKQQIKQLKIIIEDQVLPMQRELSSYGSSVYRRYEEAADQTAVMEKNLQVLMQVVAEHSGKLEQLS